MLGCCWRSHLPHSPRYRYYVMMMMIRDPEDAGNDDTEGHNLCVFEVDDCSACRPMPEVEVAERDRCRGNPGMWDVGLVMICNCWGQCHCTPSPVVLSQSCWYCRRWWASLMFLPSKSQDREKYRWCTVVLRQTSTGKSVADPLPLAAHTILNLYWRKKLRHSAGNQRRRHVPKQTFVRTHIAPKFVLWHHC